MQRLAGRFLTGRAPLFDARIRGGHVLDGHGDLLAEDIFCLPHGSRNLDCLEFDDRLRWVDGLHDAAFLAMDLERLGAGDLAEQFTGWYAGFSGDPAPASLRHHYIAYRAFVRAKVKLPGPRQGDPLAGGAARQLAAMALQHLQAGAVTLVLIGGLPGTGKLSAGRDPVWPPRAAPCSAATGFRKELAGIPAEQKSPAPYEAGLYEPLLDRTHLSRTAAPGCGPARAWRISDRRRLWISAGHCAAAAARGR